MSCVELLSTCEGFCMLIYHLALNVRKCRYVLSKIYNLCRCYSFCWQGNLCVDMSFIHKCHDISIHIQWLLSTRALKIWLSEWVNTDSGDGLSLDRLQFINWIFYHWTRSKKTSTRTSRTPCVLRISPWLPKLLTSSYWLPSQYKTMSQLQI